MDNFFTHSVIQKENLKEKKNDIKRFSLSVIYNETCINEWLLPKTELKTSPLDKDNRIFSVNFSQNKKIIFTKIQAKFSQNEALPVGKPLRSPQM